MNDALQATLAVDCRCELGEGPQWQAQSARLYWCDILGKRLHWLDPATQVHSSFALERMTSCAAPVEDGRLLLIGENQLTLFDPKRQKQTALMAFEADNPVTRSNDARVDRHGSLWLSTMGKNAEPGAGSLYRLHRGKLHTLRSGLTIPNAICFSPKGDTAYFTDTPTGRVLRWALDDQGWPIGEPEPFADFTQTEGNPDGAVMDSHGCLWLALWGAGQVVRLNTQGQIIGRIDLPVSQPSCPAFAGADLKTLYITTAREGFSAEQLAQEPFAGSLYVVETGIAGLAEPPLHLA
ncbi:MULTISPECIES: SMP-30/gluconolactonase/LRE family protein [unclassified Halomonas]|uniref:SMP-30/gluconolactonase/LRE family protein n=1 Tax=unclassified Halomonas TaxID=2609666 RepID=UPI0020A06EC8|nr:MULTISPECIES: SMP-30/gluconolactonase/LRE family protein [unclassified Halomonas]MCP1314466.1 SMP-30/gluconolactonase/LRE family protein [Halomonas sp. 707D7]MCP1326577.1 SMP-30/gluconolactonase/LRE family protein [Halomonas sp. 707D4]